MGQGVGEEVDDVSSLFFTLWVSRGIVPLVSGFGKHKSDFFLVMIESEDFGR